MLVHEKSVGTTNCYSKEQIKTIIVLGENNVGKSCILKMLTKKFFEANYLPTIVANYYQKEIRLSEREKVVLSIWDTSGNEKTQISLPQYIYKTCNYFIIVISYDNRDSLDYISDFIELIRKSQPTKAPPILVIANKSDEKDKYFFFTDISKHLEEYRESIHLTEVSAKNQVKVELLFQKIALFLTGKKAFQSENDSEQTHSESVFVNVRNSFHIFEDEESKYITGNNDKKIKQTKKKKCC